MSMSSTRTRLVLALGARCHISLRFIVVENRDAEGITYVLGTSCFDEKVYSKYIKKQAIQIIISHIVQM